MKTETIIRIEAYLEETKQEFLNHVIEKEDGKNHLDRTDFLLGKKAAIRQIIGMIEGRV